MAESDCWKEPLLEEEKKRDLVLSYKHSVEKILSLKIDDEDSVEWLPTELYLQFCLAAPMVCVSFLQYALHLIWVMFVGHLGKLELASASIAISFAGVTGFGVLIGMSSALETLCGQAYGAKQYHLLGIYLQRALVVLNIVCIPIAFVWYNMSSILIFIGQDPEISEMAGNYATWMIPSLFAIACLQPIVKFLQTQSAVLPMAICAGLTVCVHIPLCWLLIFGLNVGYRGAAMAIGASQWLNVTFLVIYVKYGATCEKTWTGFSLEAFEDLKAFFRLAIPSAVMVCLEYWSFEFMVLMSGLLPNPQLEMASLSICLNSLALLNMIPVGLSASASTRVANELGAGRAHAGQRSAAVGLILGVVEGLIMATVTFAARRVWGYAFTTDIEVVEHVAMMLPFLAVLTVLDAFQAVLSGITRGCGNQALGAFTNLGAFYVAGFPLAVIMMFKYHLYGKGLWLGMIGALSVQTIALLSIAVCTNWEKRAQEALDRVYTNLLPTEKIAVEKINVIKDINPNSPLI